MLARLGLEPGEEDFYADQLSGILAHIDRLRELDTEAIPPTAQVVPLENRKLAAAGAAGDGAGPLTGIPAAIKDVLCVEGVETTAGSRILAGYRPPYDATAVARLRAEGSAFLGMTNCDEFAMGSSTENS